MINFEQLSHIHARIITRWKTLVWPNYLDENGTLKAHPVYSLINEYANHSSTTHPFLSQLHFCSLKSIKTYSYICTHQAHTHNTNHQQPFQLPIERTYSFLFNVQIIVRVFKVYIYILDGTLQPICKIVIYMLNRKEWVIQQIANVKDTLTLDIRKKSHFSYLLCRLYKLTRFKLYTSQYIMDNDKAFISNFDLLHWPHVQSR